MPSACRSRSASHLAILAGFFSLAVAVFAWGLHAKLSLYSPGVEPSNATVAKLLIPQRPQAVVAAPNLKAPPRAPWELLLALIATVIAFPLTQVSWLMATQSRMRAKEYPDPPEILSRPPPFAAASC